MKLQQVLLLLCLCSAFLLCKDVVHFMPNKCLKAENSFNIVKHIIIGLEETDFQVLSIITDNNAINKKKIYLSLAVPPKLSIV